MKFIKPLSARICNSALLIRLKLKLSLSKIFEVAVSYNELDQLSRVKIETLIKFPPHTMHNNRVSFRGFSASSPHIYQETTMRHRRNNKKG